MDISISQAQGKVSVTMIKLDGQLDGQNFQDVIAKAQELINSGTRHILLDLTDLTYISSAGLVALHTIALLLRGEAAPDLEHGWSAYRSMARSSTSGLEEKIKLLNPRAEVKSVFEMVGFDRVFAMFSNYDEAVKSF